MKALIDTNIVLDVLLERPEFFNNSRAIFELTEKNRIKGFISASAITDIYYFINKKIKDYNAVYQIMEYLTNLFSVALVSKTTITRALSLRWKDFEDAVQYTVAKENDITHIITRNITDFKTLDIICISPVNFINHINEQSP